MIVIKSFSWSADCALTDDGFEVFWTFISVDLSGLKEFTVVKSFHSHVELEIYAINWLVTEWTCVLMLYTFQSVSSLFCFNSMCKILIYTLKV